MDRRRRAARTVALMSLFSMTDTQENVPIASFDGDGSDLISLIVGIDPVQAGSGDPSPDNVRPISGWTEAKVTRTGKNLIDAHAVANGFLRTENGAVYDNQNWNVTPFIPARGGDFTLSWESTVTVFQGTICAYDQDQQYITGVNWDGGAYSHTFTLPFGTSYIRASWSIMVGGNPATRNNIRLNFGSTDLGYTPFVSADTYSITFPTEAGTVYGGTLDVTQGKLTVDRANIASYNGETLTGRWISDRDVYSAGTTPTIGAQVVYELATPIVYDLTPTQVTTLIGTNNIWADTGDIKYIEYNI